MSSGKNLGERVVYKGMRPSMKEYHDQECVLLRHVGAAEYAVRFDDGAQVLADERELAKR